MSNDDVIVWLKHMREGGDVRFHQYLDSVSGRGLLSLRQVAPHMGVSYQRIQQLREVGRAQRRKGNHMDLGGLPFPVRDDFERTSYPLPVPPTAVDQLQELNKRAKQYRNGGDPTDALAFAEVVRSLHAGGVSFNAMARTLNEPPKTFLNRMTRWGLTRSRPGDIPLVVPAREEASMTELERWIELRIDREMEAKDPEGVLLGLQVVLEALRSGWTSWAAPVDPLGSEWGA